MAKTKSIGWALLPILVTAAILAILPSIWFGDSPYTTVILLGAAALTILVRPRGLLGR